KQMGLFVTQCAGRGGASREGLGVASRTPDAREQLATVSNRGRAGITGAHGRRLVEKSDEAAQRRYIRRTSESYLKCRIAFRCSIGRAIQIFFALVGEDFVAYALLDVIGFRGEQHERLVLRLPTEASDGAVIAAGVDVTGDSIRLLLPERVA